MALKLHSSSSTSSVTSQQSSSFVRQSVVHRWTAVEHSVARLQSSSTPQQHLLAVSDSRSAAIRVYDVGPLSASSSSRSTSPECLYRVDVVDQVRSFRLVNSSRSLSSSCLAVFHRNEPNVSFWNLAEQRTILCINVQDQTRQLTEELEAAAAADWDDDEGYITTYDSGVVGDDDDHVTSVTSIPIVGGSGDDDDGGGGAESDSLLVYGTVSGCVFGMSVSRRSKVFSVPCPLSVDQLPPVTATQATKKNGETAAAASSSGAGGHRGSVTGVVVVPSGQLVLAFGGCTSLVTVNFNVENPPDRPTTRCGHRMVAAAATPRRTN